MRKQKFLTIIAPLALLMMVLAACGGGGSGSGNANSGNLTVWGMGTEGDQLKVLAGDFMKQNPNIHVTVQSIPWTDAHSKLLTSVEGGQTPDVSQMGTTWMAEFAKAGALDTVPAASTRMISTRAPGTQPSTKALPMAYRGTLIPACCFTARISLKRRGSQAHLRTGSNC